MAYSGGLNAVSVLTVCRVSRRHERNVVHDRARHRNISQHFVGKGTRALVAPSERLRIVIWILEDGGCGREGHGRASTFSPSTWAVFWGVHSYLDGFFRACCAAELICVECGRITASEGRCRGAVASCGGGWWRSESSMYAEGVPPSSSRLKKYGISCICFRKSPWAQRVKNSCPPDLYQRCDRVLGFRCILFSVVSGAYTAPVSPNCLHMQPFADDETRKLKTPWPSH